MWGVYRGVRRLCCVEVSYCNLLHCLLRLCYSLAVMSMGLSCCMLQYLVYAFTVCYGYAFRAWFCLWTRGVSCLLGFFRVDKLVALHGVVVWKGVYLLDIAWFKIRVSCGV